MAPRSTRRSARISPSQLLAHAWIAALVVVLAGAMLGLGAIYPRAAALAAAFVAVPLALAPGLVTERRRPPALVLIFAALALVTLFQSVPLPSGLVRLLSPANADVWARAVPGAPAPAYMPISLAPELSWVEAAKWAAYAGMAWLGATWARRDGVRGPALAATALAVLAGAVTVAHGLLEAKSVFGVYHPQIEYPRWRIGPFLNSNHLSAYLSLGFFGALGSLISRRDRPPPVLGALAVAAGALVFGVLLLGSRAAFPLLVAGGLAAALIGGRGAGDDVRVGGRRQFIAIVSGVLAFGTALGVYGFWKEIRAAIGDRELTKLGAIADAFSLAKAHWTLGVGRGAFETAFFAVKTVHHNEYWPQAENVAAQWSSEWGVPVALAAGLALAVACGLALRGIARSSSARVLTVGLVVLVLHNQIDSSLELFSVGALAALLAGAVFGGTTNSANVAPRYVGVGAAVLIAGAAALALGHRPETPHDVRSRTVKLVNDGAAAMPDVVAAVRRFPADPYLALAAAVLSGRSRPLSGLAWYNRALERGPNVSVTHIALGTELAAAGRRSQALLELRLAAESDDDAALQVADVAVAIARTANEALAAAPLSKPWGLASVARMAATERPFARELRAYVFERDPCAMPLRKRALDEALASAPEAQIDAEIAAMARCPAGAYDAARAQTDVAWTRGRRKESVALLEAACAKADDPRGDCEALLAERAAAIHDDAQVRRAVRMVVSRRCGTDTGCGAAWAWASGVYQLLGDEPSAHAAAVKATEADPSNVDHWRTLAVISQGLGLRDRAARAAQRVLQRQPDDATARAILDAPGPTPVKRSTTQKRP